jgi:hypothetical protein
VSDVSFSDGILDGLLRGASVVAAAGIARLTPDAQAVALRLQQIVVVECSPFTGRLFLADEKVGQEVWRAKNLPEGFGAVVGAFIAHGLNSLPVRDAMRVRERLDAEDCGLFVEITRDPFAATCAIMPIGGGLQDAVPLFAVKAE